MRMMGSLFLAALAASAGQAPAYAQSVPADLDARVQAYVQPYADSNNFSGCVLIGEGEAVRVRRCWGLANRELGVANAPQTRFHIASVSKPFTAAAILVLEQQGRLSVSDPVSKFVPDFRDGGRIAIHNLLTHTSGIPNVNDFPDYDRNARFPWTPADIVAWFSSKPLEFDPGARYEYSNSNYNLLALIIEKASGLAYGDAIRRLVIEPAGLTATGHDGNPAAIIPDRAAGYAPAGLDGVENVPLMDWSIKTGNGSLYSTVDDLFRWTLALPAGRVLGPVALQNTFTDHVDGTGYGWFIRNKGPRAAVAANGRAPGFSSSVERFTSSGVTVVVLANLYSSIAQTMAADLAAIAHGETRQPLIPARPVIVPPTELAKYAGTWQFGPDFSYNPNLVAQVRVVDGALEMEGSGGMGTTFLIPLGGGRFLDRAYGGTVTFAVAQAGQADAVIWNFGRDYRGVRK